MSTRKERSQRNRRAHAAERAAVTGKPAPDPLDEAPMPARPPLAPIPWNKVELTDEQRGAVAQAILDHHPRSHIAKALGITLKTLKRLVDHDPALTDAADAAKDQEEAELRDALMAFARKGDTVAALFLLKSRHGYRDRDDGKVKLEGGKHGVLVVPGPMDDADFEAMVFKQQAPYRERREGEPRQPELRTHTVTPHGVRTQRLMPGDRVQ